MDLSTVLLLELGILFPALTLLLLGVYVYVACCARREQEAMEQEPPAAAPPVVVEEGLPAPSSTVVEDDGIPPGSLMVEDFGVGTQTNRAIMLTARMRHSIRAVPLDIGTPKQVRWLNNRGLHVETQVHYPIGTRAVLGKRIQVVRPWKDNASVAYELPGILKAHGIDAWAHVTVYNGPIGPHVDY